jgi:16S rRNA (guanine527-N7)-methyltransferase
MSFKVLKRLTSNLLSTNLYWMPNPDPNDPLAQVDYLLATLGLTLNETMRAQLHRHAALIRKWNAFASLVSETDATERLDGHLADALSLAPWAQRALPGSLLDIGSGGGYPAIPLKILFPVLPVTLMERNTRKVGFLRNVIGSLALKKIQVIHGDFPAAARGLTPTLVTARAVERPQVILKAMTAWLPPGTVFLCQSGIPPDGFTELFHVEQIHDAWTESGLRRGALHLLQKK